jgi:hypothetical protein
MAEKQTKKIYGTEQNQSSNTNLETPITPDINIEAPATSSRLVAESYLPSKGPKSTSDIKKDKAKK